MVDTVVDIMAEVITVEGMVEGMVEATIVAIITTEAGLVSPSEILGTATTVVTVAFPIEATARFMVVVTAADTAAVAADTVAASRLAGKPKKLNA